MAAKEVSYSNLPETVHQYPPHEALQIETPEKEALPTTYPSHAGDDGQRFHLWEQPPADFERAQQHLSNRSRRIICGLVPWTFWCTVVGSALVIAAAVGGGVGGGLAAKKDHNTVSASSSTTTSASAATTAGNVTLISTALITSAPATSTSASISTSTITSATSTLLRDCPSVNNTIAEFQYTGSQPMYFRQLYNFALQNNNGIAAVVNTPVNSLSKCIYLCAPYNVANQSKTANGRSPVCNSVCWRNTFDTDHPGYCFGVCVSDLISRYFGLMDAAVYFGQQQWYIYE
jgi:hypothetical protein